MRHVAVLAIVLLSACSTALNPKKTVAPSAPAPAAASAAPAAPAQAMAPTQPAVLAQAPAATDAAPAVGGLNELETMTLGCPKAGLNAAAREAAQVQAQGRYQFSYFRIISDSHHALYEVHFTSNDHEDPELEYCVSMYCQQGWDPKNTQISVTPMSAATPSPKTAAAAAHSGAHCGIEAARPDKPKSKKH